MVENRIRVWDLPVRICHWGFAVLIPAMWWTAENSEMGWHKRLGIMLLALLAFRIMWGFFGSSTARFSQFLKGPAAVISYLRGRTYREIGHNPAGGWSAFALLLVLSVQVVSGLFSGDIYDGATGPLNEHVRIGTAGQLTDLHESLFNVVLALTALHLAAIAFYALFKKDNLVPPMLSGAKQGPAGMAGMVAAPAWRAALAALLSGALAYWVWLGGPGL